ncbi:hypothetical protein DFH08DRAFT_827461 [Mycena albidolilacea]|uniref:Zn(2)-C6 fungal-type domain-containing protein n=1 Tax=Mycena albidolilacea TaxID=1033008 RepID=A0AAD6YY53_9AGAR|nr:hypothetical protein DFH08DRAFT_827461 [Mycena albidolilacea]
MSFADRDGPEPIVVPAKKRRIQLACDACRQKRSDGLRISTKKCSFCVENGLDCTYSGAPAVTALEARLALTEDLLRKAGAFLLAPQFSPDGAHPPGTTDSAEWSRESSVLKAVTAASGSGVVEMAVMSIRAINERERECEKGDFAHMELDGYLGQSSGATLLKTAIDLKAQYTASDSHLQRLPGSRGRRSEYWTATPWVTEVNTPQYTFPPPDLLSALEDLYFEHNSVYISLLHHPTFERALADDLHLRDDKFGANVLIVCAIASSFSVDPRVFDSERPFSCGWKYFTQVTLELEIYATPTLYDLQRYCFLEGSPLPQGTWALVGVGIRMAQEVSAHRRQTRPHTVETELWRRAFRVLVAFDRMVSCGVGRACAMQYEKYVRFCLILSLPYSLDKTRNLFAMEDHAWEERIVVELDSALNKWADGMPAHLQWDPHREDPVFFNQSVALYRAYYHVQMITHRPFIPMVREMPTLAVCTNAARSCIRVADVWHQRMGDSRPVIILRTGLAPHMNTTIEEVHKCMRVIRVLESRADDWGTYFGLMNELNEEQPPP